MSTIWEPRRPSLVPASGAVQLWRASLSDLTQVDDSTVSRHLTPDEHRAAQRYRVVAARDRFVLGRLMLRSVLAGMLQRPPTTIALQFSSYGKPDLADSSDGLSFNLSHSGDLVLLAVGKNLQLGVDVERVRDLPHREEIARGIFSASEWEIYDALPLPQRHAAFFAAWTRKEAIIKAVGHGLSFPLTDLEVSFSLHDAKLLRFGEHTGVDIPWHLQSVDVAEGYFAALAFDAVPSLLQMFQWCL